MFGNLCDKCNHKNCCVDSAVPLVFDYELEDILQNNPTNNDKIKTKIVNGRKVNFIIKKKNSTECIFWDKNTAQCRIYHVRPMDCRLYPFDILKIDKEYYWIVYSCNEDANWEWSEEYLRGLEEMDIFKQLIKNFDIFLEHTKIILQDELKKTPYTVLRKVNSNIRKPY